VNYSFIKHELAWVHSLAQRALSASVLSLRLIYWWTIS